MALDKLVDSAQLDSDLEDVADAIRAKSGGSGSLAFPAGFVSEIGSIETGGGTDFFHTTFTLATAQGTETMRNMILQNIGGKKCFFAVNRETYPANGTAFFVNGSYLRPSTNNVYTLQIIGRYNTSGALGTAIWTNNISVAAGSEIEVWGFDCE